MKKCYKYIIALMLVIITPVSAYAGLRVETTTEDIAAIAQAVGGDFIDVHSLTLGSRDPHFAVAKPSMIRRVYRADLLCVIGADMEIGWLPPLLQSARNNRVQPGNSGYLDLSLSIPLLGKPTTTITRAMGDVHAKGNPHYWLDPRNGIRMAKAIAKRLGELDAQHAADYKKNAELFEKIMTTKIAEWQKALQFLKGKKVISYHTSFMYLASIFGFNIVAQVEPIPGIAPSAASLSKLINRIKNDHINLLILEPYYERRSSAYLNEQTGIKVKVVPQSVGARDDIKNYMDLFDAIVKTLKSSGVK